MNRKGFAEGEKRPGKEEAPTRRVERPRRIRWMWLGLVAAGVAVLAVLVGLLFDEQLGALWRWTLGLDEERLRSIIEGLGFWAPLVSTGLMVVHAFVPFPLEILAIVNGLVFGAWWGILLTWGSMVVSSWAGYGAARLAGNGIHRITSSDRLERMEEWTRQRSAWQLVVVRFIPVISFALLNLAMGLLKVPFWKFTWTTALGIIPIVIVSVLAGHLVTLGPWGWALLGALIVGLVVWEVRRSKKEE